VILFDVLSSPGRRGDRGENTSAFVATSGPIYFAVARFFHPMIDKCTVCASNDVIAATPMAGAIEEPSAAGDIDALVRIFSGRTGGCAYDPVNRCKPGGGT
jgi:hypothetical protein